MAAAAVEVVAMRAAKEITAEGSTVAEAEEEPEGTTIGTVATEADSRRPAVRVSSTAKIVVDSHCQMKEAEVGDVSQEQAEEDRRQGSIWPSVPRTIRTHVEHRQPQLVERPDTATAAVTAKETEPETSIHRTTTKPFPRWEVNRLG